MDLSDRDAFLFSQRYWVPRQLYGQAAALKLWQKHVQQNNFTSWLAPVDIDSLRYHTAVEHVSRGQNASADFLSSMKRTIEAISNSVFDEDELSVLQAAKQADMRRVIRKERQTKRQATLVPEPNASIELTETPSNYANNNGNTKFHRIITGFDQEDIHWRHLPGDHVFRLADEKKANNFNDALVYEGQIPRDPREYEYRFKMVVLPQIADMIVCLLSFNPAQSIGVPEELRQILDKKGNLDHSDMKLLRAIWLLKYTDEDANGVAESLWPRDIMAGNPLRDRRVSFRCQEAAWLMQTLTSHREDFFFYFDDLAFFLGRITGVPPQVLPRMYQESMELEGRGLLPDSLGSEVLVYRNVKKNGPVTGGRDALNTAGPSATAPVNRNRVVSPALISQDPPSGSDFLRFYQQRNADLTPALEAARRIEQQRNSTTKLIQHRRSSIGSQEIETPSPTQSTSSPTLGCVTAGETASPGSSITRPAEPRRPISSPLVQRSRPGVAVIKSRAKKRQTKKHSTPSYRKTIERFFVI